MKDHLISACLGNINASDLFRTFQPYKRQNVLLSPLPSFSLSPSDDVQRLGLLRRGQIHEARVRISQSVCQAGGRTRPIMSAASPPALPLSSRPLHPEFSAPLRSSSSSLCIAPFKSQTETISTTDVPGYSDAVYSDTPLTVTLWAGPKSFINSIYVYSDTNICLQ